MDILANQAYTDFKIICDGFEFKVHKAALGPKSEYFSKVFEGGFEVCPASLWMASTETFTGKHQE